MYQLVDHCACIYMYLSHEVVVVAEAEQQVRQNVDDVGLEHPAQHLTQHLEREQRTCSKRRVKIRSLY